MVCKKKIQRFLIIEKCNFLKIFKNYHHEYYMDAWRFLIFLISINLMADFKRDSTKIKHFRCILLYRIGRK